MNDLLGGKETGAGEALAHLPKDRSPDAWRAPKTFSRTCQKWQDVEPTHRTKESVGSEAGERNACRL